MRYVIRFVQLSSWNLTGPRAGHWVRQSFASFFFTVVLLCRGAHSARAENPLEGFKSLCFQFLIKGQIVPPLTKVELRLVCGYDPEENDFSDPAWERIPFNQAKFHLTTFLQDRGYHHPKFGSFQTYKWVDVGEKTLVKSFSLTGVEDTIRINRKRKIVGQPLTPALLESMEKWTYEKLQTVGYGCPQVTSVANADTGDIKLKVITTHVQNLIEVTEDLIEGLEPGTLRRYDAFNLNEPFNGDFMTITRGRANSVVENNNFVFTCNDQGVKAHQIVVPGSPRLLKIGAGVDTEGIIQAKANWRNSRVGKFGSMMDVTARVTTLTQSLRPTFNWYFLPYVSRKNLSSSVEILHSNMQQFQSLSLSGQTGYSTTYDWSYTSGSWFVGPNLDLTWTYQGNGARATKFLFLENRISFKSNDFEFYSSSPTAGYTANLIVDISHPSWGADAPVQRVSFNGAFLVNYQDYDPPLFITGFRWGFGTLITPSWALEQNLLPAPYFQYLGGSLSVRGFGLLELPRDKSVSYLTSGFIGLEGRLVDTLPYKLEPFLFLDIGAMSQNAFSFQLPVYFAPGFGVRWSSPVGVIRSTLAHGYSGSPEDHLQFFFTFGQEF